MKKRCTKVLLSILIICTLGMSSVQVYGGESTNEREVSVIIELKENPSKNCDAINEHEKQINYLMKAVKLKRDALLYDYQNILNGAAVKMPLSSLVKVKKLSCIKDAYVAPSFHLTQEKGQENVNQEEKLEKIKNSTSYQGKGMVIAIIDTGVDVTHQEFNKKLKNVRLTKKVIETKYKNEKLNATFKNVENVYRNMKIPFAYDYADMDTSMLVKNMQNPLAGHGTSVTGVAGAKNRRIGMLPEAQILNMKVFDEQFNCNFASVLAAVEDAYTLGADIINMSLGEPCGFAAQGNDLLERTIYKLSNAGINVVVSAGNYGHSTLLNRLNGLSKAENPDIATITYPAACKGTIAVGSCSQDYIISNYIIAGERKIPYQDLFDNEMTFSNIASTWKSVYVSADSFLKSDFSTGVLKKILVLEITEETDFNALYEKASKLGVKGIIFYSNSVSADMLDFENVNVSVPSAFVEANNVELMKGNDKIVISKNKDRFQKQNGMSFFSSWGTCPDLSLKPEITAPGENVYLSYLGQSYINAEGTSLSAPYITGCLGAVKEYLRAEKISIPNKYKAASIAQQLLMSTAKQIYSYNGLPVSPRQQGNGLACLNNAVKTSVYLYNEKEINGKPQINFYDDTKRTGVYEASFYARNIGDKAVSFQIDFCAMTAQIMEQFNLKCFGTESMDVTKEFDFLVKVNGSVAKDKEVVVNAGEKKKITIQLKMKKNLKDYLEKNFKYGNFFEGFVNMKSKTNCDLSLPFMGFFGDWTESPLFERASVYNNESFTNAYNVALTDGGKHYLGINPFDEFTYKLREGAFNPCQYLGYYQNYCLVPDINKIAISPNGDGNFDCFESFNVNLLRNAKEIYCAILDSKQHVIDESTFVNETKTTSLEMEPDTSCIELEYMGTDVNGKPLKNNETVTLIMKGELDYRKHMSNNSYDFIWLPITIDLEKPVIKSMERNLDKLIVEVCDNQYVSCVSVMDSTGSVVDKQLLNEKDKNTTTKVSLDLSKANGKPLSIQVYDYAMNVEYAEIK